MRRVTSIVAVSIALAACSPGRGDTRINEASIVDPDATEVGLGIDACNSNPTATAVEGAGTITVRVDADRPGWSADDCADFVAVTLDASIGERVLIDASTSEPVAVITETVGESVVRLDPFEPRPGDLITVTFDPDNRRGGYFLLQRATADGWGDAQFQLESDVNRQGPAWIPVEGDTGPQLDYGVSGPGPDGLELPGPLDAGVWRLCTANAVDRVCAQFEI